MSLLSGFNNLLDQFLEELVFTFPELKDLRTIQTLVGLLRRMNARLVLDNFLSVAGRYREKILAKDATFFENLSNWKEDPYFQTEYAQNSEEIFQRLVVDTEEPASRAIFGRHIGQRRAIGQAERG